MVVKAPNKKTIDRVIYGLIYPGFLGSMLYELIPSKSSDFTLRFFFANSDTYIRYLILTFYFLDYVHLYGDMESAMNQNPENKDFSYFACDILTCLIYLFAFVALKISNYEITIFGFAVIPWLFLWYKRKNRSDVRFFLCYGCLNTTIALCRAIGLYVWGLIPITGKSLALGLMILNVTIYFSYVLWFYDRFSAKHDKLRFEGYRRNQLASDEEIDDGGVLCF